jgi:hypothetical protein
MHVTISVLYALAFALVVHPRGPVHAITFGSIYGALIFACNFGLTAAVGRAGDVRAGTNDAIELCAHVLYGASMAWWLERRLNRRRQPREPARPRGPRPEPGT